jgi:hypothetical protein
MTAPTPSKICVVRIYPGSAGPNQGLITPNTQSILYWPPKHPLDSDWWWVDATWLCNDLYDTIAQVGCALVSGDTAMTIPATAVSNDGLQAGFKLCQGTPGTAYTVRAHLTFTQGARWAGDIGVTVSAQAPVPTPDPTLVTNNQDIVLLGGIPFPTGVSA